DGNIRVIEGQLRGAQAEAPILLAKIRLRQALVAARSGDHAGAVAAAQAAVTEEAPGGDAQGVLACVYALASEAAGKDEKLAPEEREKEQARLRGEALAQLEGANTAGYFKQRPRVEYLTGETDLDSIRQCPEYKQLASKIRKD